MKTERILKEVSSPITLSFLLSILLSLIAILGTPVIGRDDAFYMDIAQRVSVNGALSAFNYFNWPWYSILIAYTHNLTGLSHEKIAFLYSIFMMAGTSSIIVSIVKRRQPEAAYWAVLIVLSIPVFNAFRGDLLREIGFWFFITLSLWLITVSPKKITWLRGFFVQLSIVAAMLFRLEAIFLLASVFLYLIFLKVSFKQKIINLLKTYSIIIAALILIAALSTSYEWYLNVRVAHYLSMIQPLKFYQSFMEMSNAFASIALKQWSYSDAPIIILSGIFIALCINILQCGGLASLLFIPSQSRRAMAGALNDFSLYAISAGLYFLVLYRFYIDIGFINARYSSLLLLLLVPFFAVAAKAFFDNKKKLAITFIVLSSIMALSNVVSTGGSKSYFLDAAKWIENNTSAQDKIYYEEGRIAYYAGRGYSMPEDVVQALLQGDLSNLKNYQYFVIALGIGEKDKLEHIEKRGFKSIYSVGDDRKVIHIIVHSE